jgi:intracellular multiplication protein IcmK
MSHHQADALEKYSFRTIQFRLEVRLKRFSVVFLAAMSMMAGAAVAQKVSDESKQPASKPVAKPVAKAAKPSLPPLPAELPKPVQPTNLEQARDDVMPLTPEQILELKTLLDKSRRAANTHVGVPPKPTSGSVQVDMSPGSPPPVVRLAPGHVTTLSFVDLTGSPWPITSIINGDPKSFDIKTPETDSNTATIAAMGWYSVGNAAVMLKGLSAPISVTLVGGQKEVDYRLDMRIPRRGSTPGQNPDFLNILDGVAPSAATPLKVDGEGSAWMLNGAVVYRTRYPMISPAWTSKVQSSDGTLVYEIPFTPVLLISVNGSIKEVRVSQ